MKINKKYVIKKAESTHYCSGIREWNPHLENALLFSFEGNALDYIINDKCILDKGERLLILPTYNTI